MQRHEKSRFVVDLRRECITLMPKRLHDSGSSSEKIVLRFGGRNAAFHSAAVALVALELKKATDLGHAVDMAILPNLKDIRETCSDS